MLLIHNTTSHNVKFITGQKT